MKKWRKFSMACVIALLCGQISGCAGNLSLSAVYKDRVESSKLRITEEENAVSIENGTQKVSLKKNGEGKYEFFTYIKKGGKYEPMFDSGAPLCEGENFNNLPDSYEIVSNDESNATVLFKGKNEKLGYDFDIEVQALKESDLISVTQTNHLTKIMTVEGMEPRFMLWKNGAEPSDMLTIYQQIPNYRWAEDYDPDTLRAAWNNCYPMAYIWHDGMESAVFFDMNVSDWFSVKYGVNRFLSMQTRQTTEDGRFGIGLDMMREQTKKIISSGDMVTRFYLYGSAESKTPTKMEALVKSNKIFASCFPKEGNLEDVHNYIDEGMVSYEFVCSKISEAFTDKSTYKANRFYKLDTSSPGVWQDDPLFPEDKVSTVITRSSYMPDGAYLPENRNKVGFNVIGNISSWNVNFNVLIPWIAFAKLNPNESWDKFIDNAVPGTKTYYDYQAKLIRDFEATNTYLNRGSQFSFQHFYIGMETLRGTKFRDIEKFDPAVGGQYIMGLEGIMELAEKNNYILPHMWRANDKAPMVSVDYARVGYANDPYCIGSYALDMVLAYDYTGDEIYLEEAKKGAEFLFLESTSFSTRGATFDVTYSDPYDFPENDAFNAPEGAAACQWLYKITGEKKWLTYADYFRAVSLRLLRWYESNLKNDKMDIALQSAGVVNGMPEACSSPPWEAINFYQAFLMELKNEDEKPSELTLRMFNNFRVSAFSYIGAFWDPKAVPSAKYYQSLKTAYLVAEDNYSPEQGTVSGYWGPCTYMSSNPYYCYLFYEAFAESSDKDILTLNLDVVDDTYNMINGIERNFILYNPKDEDREITLKFKDLREGSKYKAKVSFAKGGSSKTLSGSDATQNGIVIKIPAGQYARVKLSLLDKNLKNELLSAYDAQKEITKAYALLQQKAREIKSVTPELSALKEEYLAAKTEYDNKNYKAASDKAEAVLEKTKKL